MNYDDDEGEVISSIGKNRGQDWFFQSKLIFVPRQNFEEIEG